MIRMDTVYSGLSYETGTTLAGCGISAKIYAEAAKTAKEVSWVLADRIAGLSLSDWAIIIDIACTVITCAVSWYYRKKEGEDRPNGNITKAEE